MTRSMESGDPAGTRAAQKSLDQDSGGQIDDDFRLPVDGDRLTARAIHGLRVTMLRTPIRPTCSPRFAVRAWHPRGSVCNG